MASEPSEEVAIRLTAAEWNDMLAQLQRSITWSQQLISKIVIQAKAQEQSSQPPPAPANGKRPRPPDGGTAA